MTVELGPLTYQADGVTLTGWLADGSGGKPAPGVIVAHEAPGLGPGLADNVRAAARRLAARGYVALVSDMYGAEIAFAQAMEKHTELMETPSLMLARARAALDALAARPNVDQNRMAAMGFCQGGIVSLELARAGAPVKAAIGFHPGFLRPAGSLDRPISAKILMMIGDDDPVIPLEHRAAFAEEMKAKRRGLAACDLRRGGALLHQRWHRRARHARFRLQRDCRSPRLGDGARPARRDILRRD